jgi:hypothetical protein
MSNPATAALSFDTPDPQLAAAFVWASHQAAAYAFHGDPVGDWYEAALPGRQAFCIRDTAHQSLGAHFLGLDRSTQNMLRRFAENISDSKDWCSYWEINRNNLPAPADYFDDAEFWYNLPANFDVLDACWRMYLWSGDSSYISDPVFQNFYGRSVHDYVNRWDLSLDRVMTRRRIMNVRVHTQTANRFQRSRGIPSYDEENLNFVLGVDLLAAQYAGYLGYARMMELYGDREETSEFRSRAAAVRELVNDKWWDEKAANFYSVLNMNHRLEGHNLNPALLYYGVAQDGNRSNAVLTSILDLIEHGKPIGIELQSHFPEILYRYGNSDAAYRQILDLARKDKPRREYPEVSYSVVGAIMTGVMGIGVEIPEPRKVIVVTIPQLTRQTPWAQASHVPVRANEIGLRHDGLRKSTLENTAGPSILWKACFPGEFSKLLVGEEPVLAEHVESHGHGASCAELPVESGNARTVRVSN